MCFFYAANDKIKRIKKNSKWKWMTHARTSHIDPVAEWVNQHKFQCYIWLFNLFVCCSRLIISQHNFSCFLQFLHNAFTYIDPEIPLYFIHDVRRQQLCSECFFAKMKRFLFLFNMIWMFFFDSMSLFYLVLIVNLD